MKYTSQGFILFITLIVIATTSLLVLASMQHVLLYYQAINKQEHMHRNFYQLEKIAMQLAHSPATSNCTIHADSANQSIQKLIQKEGCLLNNGSDNYHYFIEDLGEFPCLVTQKQGRTHATYHRRISVTYLEEGYPSSLLQIRFINVGAILDCPTKTREIAIGLSSWRYLASINY